MLLIDFTSLLIADDSSTLYNIISCYCQAIEDAYVPVIKMKFSNIEVAVFSFHISLSESTSPVKL